VRRRSSRTVIYLSRRDRGDHRRRGSPFRTCVSALRGPVPAREAEFVELVQGLVRQHRKSPFVMPQAAGTPVPPRPPGPGTPGPCCWRSPHSGRSRGCLAAEKPRDLVDLARQPFSAISPPGSGPAGGGRTVQVIQRGFAPRVDGFRRNDRKARTCLRSRLSWGTPRPTVSRQPRTPSPGSTH
jgi:hypothetical protein